MPKPATPSVPFRSGFIAIAGAPNVGKSTLLNRVLGEKISITSKKPQTTRNRILGILHRPAAQLVFVDTPGVHAAAGLLNRRIVDTAIAALADADVVLAIIDAASPEPDAEEILLSALARSGRPVVLAINKIDLLTDKSDLLRLIDSWSGRRLFEALVPISARRGTQVPRLVQVMEGLLPLGPALFPEDSLTDRPRRFIVAEMIREKVFRLTGAEIPYASAVTIDKFSRQPRGSIHIFASIHVERASQKGIIIGKKGAKLRQIGEAAREDIERFLQSRVFLKLHVKVQKNWSRDSLALQRLGYE